MVIYLRQYINIICFLPWFGSESTQQYVSSCSLFRDFIFNLTEIISGCLLHFRCAPLTQIALCRRIVITVASHAHFVYTNAGRWYLCLQCLMLIAYNFPVSRLMNGIVVSWFASPVGHTSSYSELLYPWFMAIAHIFPTHLISSFLIHCLFSSFPDVGLPLFLTISSILSFDAHLDPACYSKSSVHPIWSLLFSLFDLLVSPTDYLLKP